MKTQAPPQGVRWSRCLYWLALALLQFHWAVKYGHHLEHWMGAVHLTLGTALVIIIMLEIDDGTRDRRQP
jgi:hypothetical protein